MKLWLQVSSTMYTHTHTHTHRERVSFEADSTVLTKSKQKQIRKSSNFKIMWQEFIRLRENYLKQIVAENDAYREYLRDHFLYEIFKLAGHLLPEEQFQYIIHNNKRPHEPEQLRVYDLWQAWLYTKEQADKHQTFSMELIQKINAKVMKHTGKEITTTIGRYDSSLGDFRLEEDYNSVYPIADYTQIPELLNALCRKVNAESQEGKVIPLIKTGIHYLFEFAHIKPFGEGNTETGMLSMNYLFLRHHQPLLIIFSEDRPEALNAIKSKDISQTPEEFEYFMLKEQIKFLKKETD